MASEHHLHLSSILFAFAEGLLKFALPALLALVTAGSAGWGWPWMRGVPYQGDQWDWPWMPVLLVILPVVVSIGRYLSFRYRYEANEMVIRTGFFFRNERHVPYARIQNLDAIQNVFHRLLGVADVRVETGGGKEPEARMSVLPVGALAEMRQRVFAGRERSHAANDPVVAEGPVHRPLLQLAPQELLLCGLLEQRGLVAVAAATGLLWQTGLLARAANTLMGDRTFGPGDAPEAAAALFGVRAWLLGHLILILLAAAGVLLFIGLVSMAWAFVRLYGFRVVRVGPDLRTEYGLLTRVTATIPLPRVQTLTIREGPGHRLLGRVSVSVQTAGGTMGPRGGESTTRRERLAPILGLGNLAAFVRHVLPALNINAVGWRGHHPRAFARKLKASLAQAVGVLIALASVAWPLIAILGWWSLAPLPILAGLAFLHARMSVRHLGWALTDDAVLFRSGWLWRSITVAPFAKIQAVTLRESPFDRRALMAGVSVDAAGATPQSHRVDIPYLGRDTARDLHAALSARAAGTAFNW